MSLRNLKNKNVRKLTKVGGGTLSVTLPKELVGSLNWKDKQKVVVKRILRGLTITDWKSPGKAKARHARGK